MKARLVLKTFALLVAILLLTAIAGSAHAMDIRAINFSGNHKASDEEIRDVLPIRVGDEFSFPSLDMSVTYLRQWGIFDSINVSPKIRDGGVTLDFILVQATIIASIDFSGNYPFLEDKIRKYLSIHAGNAYTPGILKDQIDRIKTFYKRQGFADSEVYVDEEFVPDMDGVALTFHIHRGASLRYRNIEVRGNKAYPLGRFVSTINTYKTFTERRLRASIRKLKEFYHLKGFPRARVKLVSKKIDFGANRVDIIIDIYEGPHVNYAFAGAKNVSRKELRKRITLLQGGTIDELEIEASAQAMKAYLKDKGYPDARITGTKTEQKNGDMLITFDIAEGKSRRISHIIFKGSPKKASKPLSRGMANRRRTFGQAGTFYPEEMKSDDEAIIENLKRDGYLNAKVGRWKVRPSEDGYSLTIDIPIETGTQTRIERISFVGNKSFPKRKLLKALSLKVGKPIDEPSLVNERRKLISFYADNGYPYARVDQNVTTIEESGSAVITYTIDEGELVRIGRVLYLGDILTSQKAIHGAMNLHEGDVFSYRKILESKLNIRRLGPFSAVSIEPIGLAEKKGIVHLRVQVEERRPFYIDTAINYSTKDDLTGSLSFTNINSFGWAKTNTLKITGGRKLSRAEVLWLDPRFLGSSFEMTTNGWVQYKRQPTYAYTQIGGGMGWFRRYRRLGFLFRYELDRNYFIQGDSVAADADSLRDNTLSQISLSSSYDSRNSFAYPTRGFFTLGKVDIFNEIKGNEANFVKLTWQGENEVSFLKRITLSTALRLNRILTIGENVSVPTNQLLFLGGSDTIRGFDDDSLGPTNAAGEATGSRTRWIWNEELRFRVWRTISWAFFFDMGSLTNTFSDINWFTIRRSFGIGLRYITPVGPIRADYGFKLDRRAGESIGKFNLTFGYVF
jgi:outer membrane protein insertion porin family